MLFGRRVRNYHATMARNDIKEASALSNTEWSGKMTPQTGQLILLSVRFHDDSTASFYNFSVNYSQWTRAWQWNQNGDQVTITGTQERYQGTISWGRIIGSGMNYGKRFAIDLTFKGKF